MILLIATGPDAQKREKQLSAKKENAMRLAILIAAVAMLSGTGCALFCPENDCIETRLKVCVVDAESGEPVATAAVHQFESDGSEIEGGEFYPPEVGANGCWSTIYSPDRVVVRAAGYADASFEVALDKDTCGNIVGEEREVRLSRKVDGSKVKKIGELPGC